MEKKTPSGIDFKKKVATKTPKDEYNITVSLDGSGDFTSIQEAINATKSFPSQRVIINLKNGIYNEKVKVHSWNNLISLIGESKEQTIITHNDSFGTINLGRNSTFYTPTLLVEGNDFFAKNITVQNTAGKVGQAIALSLDANRVLIENCNLLGNQDTLYLAGEGSKQYFKDCYIEGTTDFVFGQATVLFENCNIHNLSDSFTTAASTPEGVAFGFVFKDCQITADQEVKEVYLGRPWRAAAKTVFITCEMGRHIKAEAWLNWDKLEISNTTFYAEYNCSGEGFQPEKRVSWSHQLKKSEAIKYTKENILGSGEKDAHWFEKFNH